MAKFSFLEWLKLIGGVAAIFGLVTPNLLPPGLAQTGSTQILPVQFNRPPLSNRGAPGDRQGGASRSGEGQENAFCEREKSLTALAPEYKESKTLHHVWQLTFQESPTLWFYIPYSSTEVSKARLLLWDETEENRRKHQLIYQGAFALTETPGVVSLTPSPLTLKRGRQYHWYLSISGHCSSQTQTIGINGWIWLDAERGDRVLALLPLQTSEREKVVLYAQLGIWTDALTLLTRSRAENSTFAADWRELLSSVGLEHLASEKIISCCSLTPLEATPTLVP